MVRILFICLCLALCPTIHSLQAREEKITAISGKASGEVQKVGFRAHIFKAAIRYNLAGMVKNNPDGTVSFTLQGNPSRIDKALKEANQGSKRSDVAALTSQPTSPAKNLTTFTVYDWTSQTRDITHPYDLIFTLRPDNSIVSSKNAKREYYRILEETLQGEDKTKIFKQKSSK